MKQLSITLLMAIILTLATLAQAMDVCLQWDQNQEPDLAGYKIYYDTDDASPPYEATGSPLVILVADDQDPSPGTFEYTLTGLSEQNYWLCVTAYDNELPPQESGYSNVVSTDDFSPGPPATPGIRIKAIVNVAVNVEMAE